MGMLNKAEKAKRLRTLLVKSVNAHLKKGGKLVSGGFQSENGYCPIGCATLDTNDGSGFESRLSKKLGFRFTENDMWDFIHGFDNTGSRLEGDDPLYTLGVSLRKKYAKSIKRGF